jgi:hypothetical protein
MSSYDLARAAARNVDPYREPNLLDEAVARFERARARRQAARSATLAVMVIAFAIAVAWIDVSTPPPDAPATGSSVAVRPDTATPAAPPPDPPRDVIDSAWLRIGDSEVMKLDDANFEVTASGSDHAQLRLHAGGLRIASGARLTLDAGRVAIRAHHAVFSASSRGNKLVVEVDRGAVSLGWPGGAQQVVAGGSATVSTVAPPAERVTPPAPDPTPPDAEPAPDRVGRLLEAADDARRSGDARKAIALLREAAEAVDSRRPTVLFTLGKLLLGTGQAESAAAVFAEAAADPHGLLIEDALAREIEAWAAASKLETARARARTYLVKYPHGVFRDAVRQWSKLSP